jgi:hypothetical protein
MKTATEKLEEIIQHDLTIAADSARSIKTRLDAAKNAQQNITLLGISKKQETNQDQPDNILKFVPK